MMALCSLNASMIGNIVLIGFPRRRGADARYEDAQGRLFRLARKQPREAGNDHPFPRQPKPCRPKRQGDCEEQHIEEAKQHRERFAKPVHHLAGDVRVRRPPLLVNEPPPEHHEAAWRMSDVMGNRHRGPFCYGLYAWVEQKATQRHSCR
jgi:hypothetical protein